MLRRRPCERLRMTRGRCGSLLHFRMTFAFTTPRRFNRRTRRETMQRKASAVWQGGLKDGKGTISTDSGVLKQTQYSFSTRFENGVGTNPEELLATAHAGSFTLALSAQLGTPARTAS